VSDDGKAPRTLTLEVAPGADVTLDLLPAQRPGMPAYVFLHGLASARVGVKSNALLARAQQQGRGFARFDFRGHGNSEGVLGQVTLSEYIADTVAVLQHVGDSILVGSSLGGLVAAFCASQQSGLVKGLLLLSPALGFLPHLEQRMQVDGRLQTSEGRSYPIAPRVLDDARTLDEIGLPGRLPMPVFVAHGTADDVIPVSLSERFVAAVPHEHKELMLVADGDHRLADPIEQIYDRSERFFAQHGS
jgi:pimeloyl-ACP methyl ester carboxylesterase